MLNTLAPGAVGAEDLTPEELPFLRFEAEAQELFDGWRADLEHRLRAEEDHPVLLSHLAKYRSLLPSLALLFHLIDGVDTGRRGPVSCAAAAQAAAWCEYLAAHARRLYAAVTDAARVAAALLASDPARRRPAGEPVQRARGVPPGVDRAVEMLYYVESVKATLEKLRKLGRTAAPPATTARGPKRSYTPAIAAVKSAPAT